MRCNKGWLISFFLMLMPVCGFSQDDASGETSVSSDDGQDAQANLELLSEMEAVDSSRVVVSDWPDGVGRHLDTLLSVYHYAIRRDRDCVSDSVGEVLSDSVYMERLHRIPAEMELVYNDVVKRYIELYTVKRRKQVEFMLGIGQKYYFPIFEQALDAAGLPIELKYLPVIESALNPRAFSRAGASGLWQFMYSTGKIYGLEGNSLVDDRRDPIKATNAAVRFLRDLYRIYNDWSLVIAAYNCGPGNVNKAIRRSGGKRDYWAIYPYLPLETRGYVPAFIAATYTMEYYREHKFCPAAVELPSDCDTVMFSERLHLSQVAEVLCLDMDLLRNLNPQYRKDVVPGNGVNYSITLPRAYAGEFIGKKDSILAYKADSLNLNRIVATPAKSDPYYGGASKGTYVVKSGDTLYSIAKKKKVTVAKIKKWNNLKSDYLRVGQRLKIY